MRCELARRGISDRLDAEHATAESNRALDDHLSTCTSCRRFARDARRVRASVRLRVAEPVPDLVQPIMAAVRAGPAPGPAVEAHPASIEAPDSRIPFDPPTPRPRGAWRRLTPVAAALLAGVVIGSLLVGGPWPSDDGPPAAVALSTRILARAERVTTVRARYTLTERNFAFEVPEREFDVRLAFEAPERLSLEVRDRTATYPDASWIRNDVSYVVNRSRSALAAPSACPLNLPRACPRRTVLVHDRPPFSSATPLPLDLVLPVNVFGGGGPVQREPGGNVLGRPTERVVLPYEQAAPLFSFLRIGGRWRPYYAHDRVELWLEKGSWFPLRATITATPSEDRFFWEQRFELPHEHAGRPLLRLAATRVVDQPSPPRTFRVSPVGSAVSEGARPLAAGALDIEAESLAGRAIEAAGMDLYRTTTAGEGDGREVVVSSVRGLQWLTIGVARSWNGPEPLGVGDGAQLVRLGDGGVAYLDETRRADRRISIHTPTLDLVLASNLPQERLLEIASAVHLRGKRVPGGQLAPAGPPVEGA